LLYVRNLRSARTRRVGYEAHIRGIGALRSIADPVLSPTGRWLAVEETYTGALWLTDVRRGGWRRLAGSAGGGPVYRAAFSGNGRFLLLRSSRCSHGREAFGIGRLDLHRHRIRCVHGSGLRNVNNFESNDLATDRAGRYALFLARLANASRRSSGSREYRYDFATGRRIEITPGGSERASGEGSPAISGDGNLVLVEGSADFGDAGLYVRDIAAGTVERVDAFPGDERYVESMHPALSADGRTAFYRGRSDGAFSLYLRSPLDAPAVRLGGTGQDGTGDSSSDVAQASGDGRAILFSNHVGRLMVARP
jgi:hypothetical protein